MGHRHRARAPSWTGNAKSGIATRARRAHERRARRGRATAGPTGRVRAGRTGTLPRPAHLDAAICATTDSTHTTVLGRVHLARHAVATSIDVTLRVVVPVGASPLKTAAARVTHSVGVAGVHRRRAHGAVS